MKKIILLLALLLFANANDNFYYQKDKKVFLTPIKSVETFQKTNSSQIDYYKTEKDYTVGISKEFIVKIKEEKALENLIKKYSIIVNKRLAKNLYLMEVNSTQKTFIVTNELYHDSNVSYAHPNFIKKIEAR